MRNTASANNTNSDRTYAGRSLAEWVSSGIAFAVVLGIAALVLFDWLGSPSTPPELAVTQSGTIRATGGQFYVPFEVQNNGKSTAEAVQIIGELTVNGVVVEQGEQTIDFLAGAETQEGAFVFTRDPAQGELELRVASYKLP